jgi:hypothetical protein
MAKQREIIGTDPSDKNKVRVKVEVDDRGTPKPHEYSMFKDAETFRQAVLNAVAYTPEDYAKIEDSAKRQQTLNWYFDKYDYALGLEERASVRAAVAAESTVIMVDKVPTDLMNLPLENLVFGINGAKMMKLVGKDVPGAFVVAERKLIEAGKARINAQGALEIAG